MQLGGSLNYNTMNEINIDNDVTYYSYLEPEIPISGVAVFGATAVTSINGIPGPSITFSGGTSGFSFAPGGTTITLVSPITTKGDLYTRNATTGDRLPVGANTFVLSADSAETTGLKWIANATGTVTSITAGTGITLTPSPITTTGSVALTVPVSAANGGTGIANNAASTITISGNFAMTLTVTNTTSITLPTTGTLATLAGSEELTNKTLNASVGKGTWTASGTWTLPAHTLGGAISGGGNNVDNIIIGATTALAGTFTQANITSRAEWATSVSFPGSVTDRGRIYWSNVGGLTMYGFGSTYDANFANRSGSTAVGIIAGTASVQMGNNVGIGTATFGTSASNTLALFSGTVPGSSPADTVQLFSVDISAGNASLGIRTETAVNVSAAGASDAYLDVKINGTAYKLLLHT